MKITNHISSWGLSLYIIVTTVLLLPYQISAQDVNWDSEFEQGFTQFQQGNFVEAFPHLEKIAHALPSFNAGTEVERTVYFVCGLCAQQMGDLHKSIDYNSKALELQNLPINVTIQLLGSQLQNYSELSMNENCNRTIEQMMDIYRKHKYIEVPHYLMGYYLGKGDFEKVIEFEKGLSKLITPIANTVIAENTNNSQWYGINLSLAYSFKELKNFDKALNYYQKAIETAYTNDGLSLIHANMSQIYEMLGNKELALEYQKLSVNSGESTINNQEDNTLINKIGNAESKKSDEENIRNQADRQLELGRLYSSNGQYKESIESLLYADSLYVLLNDNEYHAYALVHLYNSYHTLGDKPEYDRVRKNLKFAYEADSINNLELSLIISSQMGKFYKEDGDYERAVMAFTRSYEAEMSLWGATNSKIFPSCYHLASLYLELGNLKKALSFLEQLKTICEANLEMKTEYLSYLLLYCEYLNQIGDIGSAISILETTEIDIERIKNPELISLLFSTHARLYAAIGDFEHALYYGEKAVSFGKKSYGNSSINYVHDLLNLGEFYTLNDNYEKGLMCVENALKVIKSKYGTEHPEYYNCLNKLVSKYYNVDRERYKSIRRECLILSGKLYGENSMEYADNLIFSVNLSLNPAEDDLKTLKRAIEIRENIGRDFDQFYLANLSYYSTLLFVKQEWEELLKTSQKILRSTREYISFNLQKMSSTQRESLWSSVKQSIDGLEGYAIDYFRYAGEQNDFSLVYDFGRIIYNARLIKKGLLLEANKQLLDLINTSTDPEISALYNQICSKELQLSTSGLNADEIFSLRAELNSKEKELIKAVAPNGEFVNFLDTRWQDVQYALQPSEVAVEFFSYMAQNRKQYGAVILSKKSDPFAVPLFCEDELEKFSKGGETLYDYNNSGLYDTIWGTLEVFSDVREAHTIFFSADNILNTIAIENLINQVDISVITTQP